MRHQKLLCLLALSAAASGISTSFAQTIIRARAVGSYREGVMFRLHKMSDPKAVSECKRVVVIGTVESAEQNDQNEIVKFSLKTRNGETQTINLPEALYPQLPIEAEHGLAKMLTEGKKVRVATYECPSAVGVLEADEIRVL